MPHALGRGLDPKLIIETPMRLYSLTGKTPYHQISRISKAWHVGLELFDRSKMWQASRHCSCQISERSDNFKTLSISQYNSWAVVSERHDSLIPWERRPSCVKIHSNTTLYFISKYLYKNTLKFIFPSLTNNRCTHVIGLYHEATNYYLNQSCHWCTFCCTTKGTKRKAKHFMNLPDPNKMKTELQNPRELQSLKLTVCRSGNQRIIEIIIVI